MTDQPARVLITGGAGFIGAHLAAACQARGDEVHIAVHSRTSLDRIDALGDRITVHADVLGDRSAMARCFDEVAPDEVFHLATGTRRVPEPGLADAFASIDEDLRGLLTLLSAAAGARRPPRVIVRAGSLAEYGATRAPYVESQREAPTTSYASALLAGTQYARMLQPRLPFPVITARLALVYGAGQSTAFLVAELLSSCLSGGGVTIRRPDDRRDLLYVDDAVAGLLRLASGSIRGGGTVNLATGIALTMRQVATTIVNLVGCDPQLIAFGTGPATGGMPDFRGSPYLARSRYGWAARVPFADGVSRTLKLMRQPQMARALAC